MFIRIDFKSIQRLKNTQSNNENLSISITNNKTNCTHLASIEE